jgi:hypothetical protein
MRLQFQNNTLIRLLLACNLLLILSLLLAYLAPYLSPAVFWPVAFFGLGYPIIVIANLAISVLWFLLRPRYALLSLLTILAGINPLCRQWQWNSSHKQNTHNSITLVSFNVHDFSGLMDGVQKDSVQKEIFGFLQSTKPRIICLQDLPFYFPDGTLVLPRLASELGMKYFYPNSLELLKKHNLSDAILLTSYPLVATGEVLDNGKSFGVYADMLINRDTIRVYSIHLASTKLYEGKELLTTQGISEMGKRAIPRSSYHVIKKLKSAFIRRACQADILRNSIARCPYPFIVCGDHNDTPLSYAIHTIRKGLTDSFVSCGRGFGRTYGESTVPLRIDYVMASPGFVFEDYKAVRNQLSDHLPVIVKFTFQGKRK